MTVIAGTDGCRAGWICVQMNTATRQVTAALYPTAAALLAAARGLDVLCIDIPIGLAEDGPRLCDMAARKILGPPRASSVFPAPVRAALSAGTWEEACARAEAATGKRLSLQSYAILHRIRAVDALLRASPALQQVCHEVHPEVSFHYWNGGRALRFSKKTAAGRQERAALVRSHFPAGLAEICATLPRSQVALDDVLDAYAALWTAGRCQTGQAVQIPANAPQDAYGLPMRIIV